jgi:hypothetical protein
LKSYDKGKRRVLACLACPWGIANDSLPSDGVWIRELADDRLEHARLQDAFAQAKKGVAWTDEGGSSE